MNSFVIRPLRLDDADAVAPLVTELGYPSSAVDMRGRLEGLLSDPSYTAFVAEHGGAVLGLAGGRVGRYFEKNGLYAQLVILVVGADWHGRGAGAALVSAIEAWARREGAQLFTVNSGSHRHEAHRFYERQGSSPREFVQQDSGRRVAHGAAAAQLGYAPDHAPP